MIGQKILEVFWRIDLNIIFWILLWMLTYLVILNLNITVSTTLKYCCKKVLNNKLKLMEGAMKYLPKKLLGHEIFGSMVSWVRNFFWKICKSILCKSNTFLTDIIIQLYSKINRWKIDNLISRWMAIYCFCYNVYGC